MEKPQKKYNVLIDNFITDKLECVIGFSADPEVAHSFSEFGQVVPDKYGKNNWNLFLDKRYNKAEVVLYMVSFNEKPPKEPQKTCQIFVCEKELKKQSYIEFVTDNETAKLFETYGKVVGYSATPYPNRYTLWLDKRYNWEDVAEYMRLIGGIDINLSLT